MRYLWIFIRLSVVLGFAIGGRSQLLVQPDISARVFFMLFAFVGGALTTRYWIIIQYRGRPPKHPSWFANPFDLANPFEFFHMFSVGIILSSIARSSAIGTMGDVDLGFASYGAGLMAGIYWAVLARGHAGSQRA
jgi:hypothetical protein